jgi:hypothetical protein
VNDTGKGSTMAYGDKVLYVKKQPSVSYDYVANDGETTSVVTNKKS